MTPAEILRSRVGAFFRNTYGFDVDGICSICRGPSSAGPCSQCAGHESELGDQMCDSTIFFTYAQGHLPEKHQSAHTLLSYKYRDNPVKKCADDVRLTVSTGTTLHSTCIRAHMGHSLDSATYVPSSHGRVGAHPVGRIAANVAQVADGSVKKFLLESVDTPEARAMADARIASASRFILPDKWTNRVEGKHVLLVDDTWTSGASVQSAAAALKREGAKSVTGLIVARWLSAKYDEHNDLMDTLAGQYEPLTCPVSSADCSQAR